MGDYDYFDDVDALLEAAYHKGSDDGSSSRRYDDQVTYNGRKTDSQDSKVSSDDVGDKRSKSRRSSVSSSSSTERSKKKKSRRRRSKSRSRSRSRRSRSRDKHRGSRHHRSRSKSRSRRHRSKSRTKESRKRHSPTPPRLKLGPPVEHRSSRHSRSSRRSMSPPRTEESLRPEERDARTVFCMQLSQRVRSRDLEDFFASVGKVKDVRMITCNKTRRFKGIAYIEFKEIESVALALGLSGQKLLGVPIIVQPSQAEKNRQNQVAKAGALAAAMASNSPTNGPMKLYVGSLHFSITEDTLRGIFEPFGKITEILLMKDHETGRSKGFGFICFTSGEDAKRALELLNGFEIAGRPMKVGYVTEKNEHTYMHPSFLDSDEMDRAGVNLGVTGRLQLMAKLAEGTDLKLPEAATTALQISGSNAAAVAASTTSPSGSTAGAGAPPIATQCFVLSNMFDKSDMEIVTNPSFSSELRKEVIEALAEHGGAVHVHVDLKEGSVYIKTPNVSSAVAAVNTLHGRWFAGRVITAAYVPLLHYHSLFPDSISSKVVLTN